MLSSNLTQQPLTHKSLLYLEQLKLVNSVIISITKGTGGTDIT